MDDWKELFSFNRSERRGIWLLLMLLFLAMGVKLFINFRSVGGQDHVLITQLLHDTTVVKPWESKDRKSFSSFSKAPAKRDSLFFFDPNTLDGEGWKMLGLSPRQAEVITGYTAKGGRFRTKADLKKSFVISDQFYQRVEAWIRIIPDDGPDRNKRTTSEEMNAKEPATALNRPVVCLNSSDTAQLRTLSGVGEVLAARIVRYRDLLGGFSHPDQLSEVYGLKPEVVERNRHRITIANSSLTMIPVNTATQKELASHPYISQRLAYILVELRNEAKIASETDLRHRLPSGTEVNEGLWEYLSY